MYKEAIAELNHAVTLSGESTISLAMLGHAYAAAGNKNEAERIRQKLTERSKHQYVPSYWIAMLLIGLETKMRRSRARESLQERSSWLAWLEWNQDSTLYGLIPDSNH